MPTEFDEHAAPMAHNKVVAPKRDDHSPLSMDNLDSKRAHQCINNNNENNTNQIRARDFWSDKRMILKSRPSFARQLSQRPL